MGRKWVDFSHFGIDLALKWLKTQKWAFLKVSKNHLFWSFPGFFRGGFERVNLKNGHFGTPQKWLNPASEPDGVKFLTKKIKKCKKWQKWHFFLSKFGDRSHYWNNAEKHAFFVDGGFETHLPRVGVSEAKNGVIFGPPWMTQIPNGAVGLLTKSGQKKWSKNTFFSKIQKSQKWRFFSKFPFLKFFRQFSKFQKIHIFCRQNRFLKKKPGFGPKFLEGEKGSGEKVGQKPSFFTFLDQPGPSPAVSSKIRFPKIAFLPVTLCFLTLFFFTFFAVF